MFAVSTIRCEDSKKRVALSTENERERKSHGLLIFCPIFHARISGRPEGLNVLAIVKETEKKILFSLLSFPLEAW